ncbi:hypothetical protein [Paraburkholderia sp. 2C]
MSWTSQLDVADVADAAAMLFDRVDFNGVAAVGQCPPSGARMVERVCG